VLNEEKENMKRIVWAMAAMLSWIGMPPPQNAVASKE